MSRIRILSLIPFALMALAAIACFGGSSDAVIYVTATVGAPSIPNGPTNESTLPNPFHPTPSPRGPTATAIQPTPNPTYPPTVTTLPYTIQSGDTLASIAMSYGTGIEQILALNPSFQQTSLLQPGQVLTMPGRPIATTPDFKIIPDSELVNSPAARDFDVDNYIRFQPGFIRVYSETKYGRLMSGADIVKFISTSTSVNPRLLLALLEYRSGWVTNPVPSDDQISYPMGQKDKTQAGMGLFDQLSWAADRLNQGYYGFKQRGDTTLQFIDKSRLAYAPDLNPGTVAVQYFLAQTADRPTWNQQVSTAGFFTTYMAMFGDPFRHAIEPLIPLDLQQPTFTLPFPQGQIWYFTSGPHGGWDAFGSGWAAVDFAPPAPPDNVAAQGPCYVSTDFATSMVNGIVSRSGDGVVVIDLDMDGDERTGWTVTYMHMADQDRIPAGTIVQPGTPIGHPSCEGFYLNALATHVHIARRYNGEWISADCYACASGIVAAPPFVMGGWQVHGDAGHNVYQGTLEKDGQVRTADQGRDKPDNQISW